MSDRRFEVDPVSGFTYEFRRFTDDREGSDRDKMLGTVPVSPTPGYRVESRWVTDVMGHQWLKTGRFPIEPDEKPAPAAKPSPNADLENRTVQQLRTTAAMEGCDERLQKEHEKGALVAAIKANREKKAAAK